MTSQALDPLPVSQTVTPSGAPPPSRVTYFMDGVQEKEVYIEEQKTSVHAREERIGGLRGAEGKRQYQNRRSSRRREGAEGSYRGSGCVEQNKREIVVIHSGYFYSASSSPLLLRGAPCAARILCRNFTPKRHRQL